LVDFHEYKAQFEALFDQQAANLGRWANRNRGYRQAVRAAYKYYVEPASRVLEIGSGTGDLLAALEPSCGVGVDISGAMVRQAAAKHRHLTFHHMPAEEIDLDGQHFDYVILSDLVGYLYDIRRALERILTVCQAHTRLVLHWYSRLWQPVIGLAERTGLKAPQPLLNWTTVEDISNLLRLTGFEMVQRRPRLLLPVGVPLLGPMTNRYLAHLPGFGWLCLTNWIVARPVDVPRRRARSVSVVCPCRNEAGTIEAVARRLPSLGTDTELIFVEGHSKDDTLAECQRVRLALPGKRITVLTQDGTGKGDAVRRGFAEAKGDILLILDADMSVIPEDLRQFYDVLAGGRAEFVNGSRLVYATDSRSMRFLNLVGNKFFARLLSRLIGQPIKDSLCGTKGLFSDDYRRIAANRAYFGEFDPFGDFDLIFGAAKLNLKIADVPVRYHERTYGRTNIRRFTHGWLLLRMSAFAMRRMVFGEP